jgi:hypothetical protein
MIPRLFSSVAYRCQTCNGVWSCFGQPVTQYPFCIQGDDNPGWTGCSFNTIEVCQATASGTGAECLSNPWYQAGDVFPLDRRQISRWAPHT